jgi:hypothetical protein
MTRGRSARAIGAAVLLVALVAAAVGLEVARDRVYGEPQPARDLMYLTSPTAVKRMSLSFSAVLADVYWIRALQYYGGTRRSTATTKTYDLLYPLLDISTTLDPMFSIAYRFGATFLAEEYPGGAGRTDLAVKLLQKGAAVRPDNWRYLQDIGFVYYWWGGDYHEAAAWFRKAADVPGAPWWMKSLAAVTLAQGGDRSSSRLLWQSLLDGAENDWMRKTAVHRLRQLDALDQIDQLQAIARRYMSRTGTVPAGWTALVRAGYLRGIPVDPEGTVYALDAQTGVVSLGAVSTLNPLPSGQQGVAVPPR